MIFTEPIFAIFIAIVLLGLVAVRRKTPAIGIIIFASAVFYGWWNTTFLLLLGAVALVDFFLAQWIGAARHGALRRTLLIVSILWNVSLLGYFKYINFLVDNLNALAACTGLSLQRIDHLNVILPVGISFFTFETLSYTIDVYRGTFRPIRKLGHFLLFISFFPHLVAGPIVRARDFLPQVEGDFLAKRDWSGVFLILFGLAKKVLIADTLAKYAIDPAFATPESYGAQDLGFAVVCYSFQIFLDFSGYTDIAIGLARVMGFDLGLNFNAPYLSRSFSEFWRRWHISLSSWFRDYVFIPLGGSRAGLTHTCVNLAVVFLVSGLWHGADWRFVIWGAFHGGAVIVETIGRRFLPARTGPADQPWGAIGVARALAVFSLVSAAWIFFRASDWQQATNLLARIAHGTPGRVQLAAGLPLALLGVATFLHIVVEPAKEKTCALFRRAPAILNILLLTLLAALLLEQSLQRIGHKAFIYFQF